MNTEPVAAHIHKYYVRARTGKLELKLRLHSLHQPLSETLETFSFRICAVSQHLIVFAF
jgi:Holliday junction resolvasome RuvABC endonuclease subunit